MQMLAQFKENIDMTKIDIISGFLGAGKTTLIKKLLSKWFGVNRIKYQKKIQKSLIFKWKKG